VSLKTINDKDISSRGSPIDNPEFSDCVSKETEILKLGGMMLPTAGRAGVVVQREEGVEGKGEVACVVELFLFSNENQHRYPSPPSQSPYIPGTLML
jgi:hypothetical protein